MKRIQVRLPGKSYPILVGRDLVPRLPVGLREGKAFVIADRALSRQSRALVSALRKARWDVALISVEAGEKLKTFEGIQPLYSKLGELGADRRSVIFALGGGSIGDAVGFIAGTYLRGVRWVGVPSTFLAQVDSSIGGKTGVNLKAGGKNLVGVFHQPSAVLCDVDLLKSLPKRELISGLGEVIKYGLIFDKTFLNWVLKNRERILAGDPRVLERAVACCAELKARTVEADERDEKGVREVLNFGHTLGHALEAATDYGYYRHGEAVLLGMRGAIRLSTLRGHLDSGVSQELDELLASIPVPAIPKRLAVQKLMKPMERDKKNRGSQKRFVLLCGIGKSLSDSGVSDSMIREVIEELRK